MIVSISQPTLFPWLGYYNIIKSSQIFVFFDNVKFEKRSWQMRNRLKALTQEEEIPVWIRIPTKIESNETLIKDVKIDNTQDWKSKHLQAFRSHYGNNFEKIEFLIDMYKQNWEYLADFNIEFIKRSCQFLNIKTKLLKASEMPVKGKRSYLLLDICKHLGATEYLTSIGAKAYLENDKKIFENENIKIIYHDYKQPIYKQHGKVFLDHLSILDLIFNNFENSKDFI